MSSHFDIDFNGPGNLRHAHGDTPYVIISKKLKGHIHPENKQGVDFTLDTLGLYLFIRCLPPDWDFSVKGLLSILPIGRDKLTREIAVLEKNGYLIRVQVKESNGKFGSDSFWITLDNNEDYAAVVETLKQRGNYVYEKEAKFSTDEKPQVATDALKTRATDTTSKDESYQQNIHQVIHNETVEIINPQVATDALKNRPTENQTQINNRYKSTIEADERASEGKGLARSSAEEFLVETKPQPENSTSEPIQVGTGSPEADNANADEAKTTQAAFMAIVQNSPNRKGLLGDADRARARGAFESVIASGHSPSEIESAWWNMLREYSRRGSRAAEYPTVLEWLSKGAGLENASREKIA